MSCVCAASSCCSTGAGTRLAKMSPGSSSTGRRLIVAPAAPVSMLVAPGPIDVVQASVRRRFVHLGERGRRVHHRLLVAALVVAKPIAHLVERLPDAGDVAVAEDAEDASEERLPPAVALAELHAQEPDQRLRRGEANRWDATGLCSGSMTSRTSWLRSSQAAEELPQCPPGGRIVVELVEASARSRRRRGGNPGTGGGGRRRSAGRPACRSAARPSMSLATNRFCHAEGGEITTSPPMSSLQCM